MGSWGNLGNVNCVDLPCVLACWSSHPSQAHGPMKARLALRPRVLPFPAPYLTFLLSLHSSDLTLLNCVLCCLMVYLVSLSLSFDFLYLIFFYPLYIPFLYLTSPFLYLLLYPILHYYIIFFVLMLYSYLSSLNFFCISLT